jgi:hypothetical protein
MEQFYSTSFDASSEDQNPTPILPLVPFKVPTKVILEEWRTDYQ